MPAVAKITAIAPWFGSKRTLAPTIVEELGPHGSYFEPFCGSMAVLLAKPISQQETACDLHGDLTNLAWCLQKVDSAERIYDRLTRTLFCEGMLEHAKQVLSRSRAGTMDEERAYWFFIHSWCARNGTSGSARQSFQLGVRFTPSGGSPTVRFRNAIESIPAWHERLRNVVIINRNAFVVIAKISDEPKTAIYCDPPYLHSSRSGDGDGGYRHDFDEFTGLLEQQDDHAELARALRRFQRARVVVSYYDHPRLERLYPGWTKRECFRKKNLSNQSRGSQQGKLEQSDAPEVLLLNGPSFQKGK